ncbi:MAG: FAD:protein FMN transferase [Ruminococcaceae bacterium]|nr:FAD:protein FMN transferase [Oscillospiraceae bacterium]
MTRLLFIDMKLINRTKAIILILILLPSLLLSGCGKKGKEKFTSYYYEYFDTVTQIIGYADSKEEFDSICAGIEEKLGYYHKLFDIYYKYNGVNNLALINESAYKEEEGIEIDPELIKFLLFCKEAYEKTDGYVNVAMGSVLKIWHHYREEGIDDPDNASLPDKKSLIEASELSDINKLIIDEKNNRVYIKEKGVRLDVGAVAKGYTADMIYNYLKEEGVNDYLINLGGNIKALGLSGGKKWVAGIENPDKGSMESIIEYIELSDTAIVTSGSYQRYYVVDGKSYNHIIDKDTLFPADNYLSVSVITDNSANGDVLSTALFILDIEKGKELLKEFPGAEAMWVLKDGTKIYSDNFKDYIMK